MSAYERPETLEGETTRITVGCGKLYVTLNHKRDERFTDYPLFEVRIVPSFKDKEALACCNSFLTPIARLVTFSVRRLEKNDRGVLIKTLLNHECPKQNVTTHKSCVDAIARVLMCYWEGHKYKDGRCWVCKKPKEGK